MSLHRVVLLSFALFVSNPQNYVQSLEGESIIGGDYAKVNQFPYQVFVEVRNSKDSVTMCGGTIIDDFHVVTAAHCLASNRTWANIMEITVQAGVPVRFARRSKYPSLVEVKVKKVFAPKEYFAGPQFLDMQTGDIAVLKLKNSLNLAKNKHIRKLQMPPEDLDTLVGKTATVSGYGYNEVKVKRDNKGKEEVSGKKAEGKLRFAQTVVMSTEECSKKYYRNPTEWDHICAQVKQRKGRFPEGEGICGGDSGGPLEYKGMLVGVVSAGPTSCLETSAPGIYTRVSSYIDFIKDAINDRPRRNVATGVLPIVKKSKK